MTVRPGGRPGPHTAATNIQSGWRGYHTRNNDNQVSTSIQYLLVDEVPDSKVDFTCLYVNYLATITDSY